MQSGVTAELRLAKCFLSSFSRVHLTFPVTSHHYQPTSHNSSLENVARQRALFRANRVIANCEFGNRVVISTRLPCPPRHQTNHPLLLLGGKGERKRKEDTKTRQASKKNQINATGIVPAALGRQVIDHSRNGEQANTEHNDTSTPLWHQLNSLRELPVWRLDLSGRGTQGSGTRSKPKWTYRDGMKASEEWLVEFAPPRNPSPFFQRWPDLRPMSFAWGLHGRSHPVSKPPFPPLHKRGRKKGWDFFPPHRLLIFPDIRPCGWRC